ncbi:uncharacterized protein BXZ73DRAFT_56056 [Epithele typhae]|uniref:uncharacterized protein n=1 Tax=Epithele typhae TaxID=378194 RepID=UPI00200857CD|nr:uncharacterized protein BXZ73DRAFT_56056 [Epithele typhae]KAH9912678.1 hypothetical protein BXZ73DRAFT_56056 [Epithele typhae]
MSPLAAFIATLLAFSGLAAAASSQGTHKFNWRKTKYFYAFGDSYTFVQGTEGHANFSFIGDAFDFSFTPQQLLQNEIIPKNTSSDGSNWTEFLTGCFSGKPSACSRQLWNFAFAGADISKDLLPLHHDYTVALVDEVVQWEKYASHVVPHPPDETVVAWFIGINDTGDTQANTTLDFPTFWEQEMEALFGAVQNAYAHNLRGAYLFINVPTLDRSPGALGKSPAAIATYAQHIADYNAALATHQAAFADAHPDITVVSFDANKWFGEVLDNAEAFGFTNITGFCQCTDPGFFWYNTGHITEHVHRLMAGAIRTELMRASQV